MPIKLDRARPTYKRSLDDLSGLAKLHLRLAESRIEQTLTELEGRTRVMLGGRNVILEENGSLRIWFEYLTDGTIPLYLVVDMDDPPDWFLSPWGTWLDDIDLTE
jgi:hypothetical protein